MSNSKTNTDTAAPSLEDRIKEAEAAQETTTAPKAKANSKAKAQKGTPGEGYAKGAETSVDPATAPKAAKAAKEPKAEAVKEPKAPGKVAEIIGLYKAGKTKAEIIELGYNRSTVGVQLGKLKKELAESAPAE